MGSVHEVSTSSLPEVKRNRVVLLLQHNLLLNWSKCDRVTCLRNCDPWSAVSRRGLTLSETKFGWVSSTSFISSVSGFNVGPDQCRHASCSLASVS